MVKLIDEMNVPIRHHNVSQLYNSNPYIEITMLTQALNVPKKPSKSLITNAIWRKQWRILSKSSFCAV